MGGWQHNFFQGVPKNSGGDPNLEQKVNTNTQSITTLNNEVDGLMNRTYGFGENSTPFTFNGKKVYVWKFNPDQTLTMPNSGYVAVGNNQIDEVISMNLLGSVNGWETGIEWFQMPMTKRNNANNLIYFAISSTGYPCIKNIGVVGALKVKGYVVYTRD